ncbi:RNA polymerase sigma-70 factor (ECF subfamily) [Rhizobium sp. BK251]|nr:RNA polymerase sigma-70 factor (ECF subfamily) [Rhizobium sp. BK251]
MKTAGQTKALLSADELARLLLSVAAEQDRLAFAMLFGHFAPRVKAFMMRCGLSDAAAEDIAQETMLAMWHKASYFDPRRAAVSTWIFTIARNQRINRLRRERVQQADVRLDPSDEPDSPASGEDIAIAADREQQVRSALSALPTEQATIVRLSFFSERPHAEIARELGIPLGTVKSRVRLALGRLRTLLDGDA